MILTACSVEDMAVELLQNGWKPKGKHLSVSPRGQYSIGVRDAWLEMKESEGGQ